VNLLITVDDTCSVTTVVLCLEHMWSDIKVKLEAVVIFEHTSAGPQEPDM